MEVVLMSDRPLVSVVIPLYNGMAYLQESLHSVLTQTYPNVEIVITDGGSTDGSREWLESFTTNLVVKGFLPDGSGAAANWTHACELSRGKYVKLLCQDDLIYPNALASQVEDLESFPSARIAFAQRDMIDAKGAILSRKRGCQGVPEGFVSGHEALLAGYRAGTNIYGEPEAVLFERDAMLEALPWTDTEPFLLDMFFYSKILSKHPAVIRKEAVGAFRISNSSWSTRLVTEQRKQFRSWQSDAASIVGNVNWRDHTLAFLNNEKTTLLRRSAYAWLKLRKQMN
jgi:glycosyltransferase involved in cell wall biosynthesis